MRNEKHTEEERQTCLFFIALSLSHSPLSFFFFFYSSQNTIRLVYNEAFHMKLFLFIQRRCTIGVGGGSSRSLTPRCEKIIQIGAPSIEVDWRLA